MLFAFPFLNEENRERKGTTSNENTPLSLVDVLHSRKTLLATYCAVEDLHLKQQLAFLFLKQLQSVKKQKQQRL